MDQYIGSSNLATYLHPGPTGPFLELKSEPLKPPSPSTSALLQHNPSLIDLCTFNSLCQRLAESSSTNQTSPYKPFITPSELRFTITPVTEPDCQSTVSKPEPTTSPAVSSAGDCSPNVSSCTSTPHSSPQIKPLDLSSTITHKDPIVVDTKLSQKSHSSPILHRLLTSPPTKLPTVETIENENNKSPQYRPRFSPFYKPSTTSHSSRSPVFARRSPHDQRIFDTDHDSHLTANSNVSLTLLPLDINEKLIKTEKRMLETTEQVFVKRRVHQSIPSKIQQSFFRENILLYFQAIITQRNYCISYPKSISQCIDCQTANPKDFSLHLAGCRFQHCRM